MTVVQTRGSVWEALAGRTPGQPAGPAEPGVWAAVVERLNPARARPELRPGIEHAELVSVRGAPYVMVRSPDARGGACYLRLSPEEWRLARLMDGSRTVARLVAEFARIAGRLAPDQVTRVVADLAGNRMLAELPVNAFRRLDRVHRRPWPLRLGRGLLVAVKGQRMVLADIDPLVGFLYRAGGRLLFTRPAAVLLALVAVAGLGLFGWTWWRGDQAVFLTGGSYATGAAVLLGLNVVALACHELGHALATKHAGRRIPAAGFLVYFGIPSVFVDTTDVWLAGRRARMVTTASGPAAGLILAGLAQIVGVIVPEAAPWTFKLAFAWYLNALFNLNPFLALDGYYLLMDWLEIPNLRARGLAFVLARLRRRPPGWGQLDQEGRLVALYGTLAVLWMVITVNLGWRVWTDRVAGLATGVWRSGWPARLLLAAVVAGLAAPLVYVALSGLGRRLRTARARWTERRREFDAPRRLDALRRSALGALPGPALADLVDRARWLRPRTGQQLVFAGGALPGVLVVVDGALEARRPGDPAGTVRQRLGAGGVVGLANAITGAPAALAWHTAGTTLLTIPAPAVASAVGPLPGPPPTDRAEAEALFAEAPALQALSAEDRMGLACGARLATLPPGASIALPGPTDVVVVDTGVVALADGTELRRGTTIGPAGEGEPGVVATARTPVRLWHLPAVSGLPMLLGAPAPLEPAAGAPGGAPVVGVHPVVCYPPLAAPPGLPPADLDPDIDRRFERKLWWLVLLFLLLALLLAGSNLMPGPAWAEMPADKALLIAERGRVEASVDGRTVALTAGGRVYVGEGDRVRVGDRSSGRLIFRGGSTAVLCPGARAGVGPLWSVGIRPAAPNGALTLGVGRILADTASTSPFEPLALTLTTSAGTLTNRGPALFATGGRDVEVSTGEVRVDGVRQPTTGAALDCGAGRPVAQPAASSSAGPTPSATPTPTPSPSPTPGPPRTTKRPTTRPPAPSPTTTRPAPPPPPPPPPPDGTPPTITELVADPRSISRPQCPTDGNSTVSGLVADNVTPAGDIQVTASWSIPELGEGASINLERSGGSFEGKFAVAHSDGNAPGATILVTITAVDAMKNSWAATVRINLEPCPVIG